ncbi:unnamed protein product [Mesocestoides corti]|uniref:Uncharacterized protein n=1 Tax=Mesocestoides corti TaxID=53468 RepID=A0A0R3U2K6_MESCO|nr:unnamed protein product [Mesocestoides corti]
MALLPCFYDPIGRRRSVKPNDKDDDDAATSETLGTNACLTMGKAEEKTSVQSGRQVSEPGLRLQGRTQSPPPAD